MNNKDDLLNPYYIRDFLPIESSLLVPVIQVFESTDSTNNVLLEKNCVYPNGHTCFAEKQTRGRGVSDKEWVDVKKNICFSVAWNYEECHKHPHMLNFLLAVKVVNALKILGYKDICAKWPNDIVHDGSKLAGILIDSKYKKDSKVYMVIGIGLNIDTSIEDKNSIGQEVTDLYSVDKKIVIPRNKIAASILTSVIECLSEFYNYDLKKLSDEWNLIDYNLGKDKIIVVDKKRMNVEIKGINNIGQLCCSHNGKLNFYNFNEVEIIKDEILCD